MSDRARNYVKHLDNSIVSSSLKVFLFFVADYHENKNGCAWPGIQTVAEDMGKSVRQIQRLVKQCVSLEIISYHAGDGRGRLGKFIFNDLEKGDATGAFSSIKGDAKGDGKGDAKGDAKGDISDSVIRKEPKPEPKPRTEDHHAFGALKIWLDLKQQLKTELPADEWNLWVRPTLLLRELDHKFLLLAVPPNNRIMAACEKAKPMLREKLKSLGFGFGFTKYPDEYQLEKLAKQSPEWGDVARRLKKPAASERSA